MQYKQKLGIILIPLLLGAVICQEDADQAGSLLTSLAIESEAKLKEFDDTWKENHSLIKGNLDSIYSDFLGLEQECKDRQGDISNTDQESENSEHYIEWIGEKIKENLAKIEKLEAAHCKTSSLYINGLKHNKIALKLIEFLRAAIQKKDNLSLAQRRQIVKQLTVFFQMYAQNEMKAILMLQNEDDTTSSVDETQFQVDTDTSEQARTDGEIGQGHIDNGREKIDVDEFDSSKRRDWPTYKKELIALLDKLEAQITEKMDSAQDEQINSGISLADFKITLESENQDLDRHLAEEAERIKRLAARKLREQNSYDNCMDELNAITEILIETRAEYEDKVESTEKQRKSLQEEVDLFQQVWQMYQKSVEVGEYQDREVDSFNILK